VGVLLCALYLGGIAPRMGFASARQLLAPSLIVGWVWRLWVFLAALASVPGLYRTHFFDPSQGRVAVRLLELFWGRSHRLRRGRRLAGVGNRGVDIARHPAGASRLTAEVSPARRAGISP